MARDSNSIVLDHVDHQLITQLETDGRMSFVQLGDRIGLSAEAARVRYLRLSEQGVINVIGVVHPAHAGLRSVASVTLSVHGHLDEFTTFLQQRREITFLAWTRGEFNICAEVACTDSDALMYLVYDEIAAFPGVVSVRVDEFLHMYKWQTGVRVAQPASAAGSSTVLDPDSLSGFDTELIRLLHEDGRRSYRQLADELGEPYGVVRRRTQTLLDAGIVQIAAVVDRIGLHRTAMATIHLSLTGDIDAIFRELATIPAVEILSRTGGWYQGVGEVTGSSTAEIVEIIDHQMCTVPGVRSVSVHFYTAIKKLPSQWRFPTAES